MADKDWTNIKRNRKRIAATVLSGIFILLLIEIFVLVSSNKSKAYQGTSLLLMNIESSILRNEFDSTPRPIQTLVSWLPVYEGIQIVIAAKDTQKIIACTQKNLIGNDVSEVVDFRVSEDEEPELGIIKIAYINSIRSYCTMKDTLKYVIYVGQRVTVANRGLFLPVFIIFVYLILACAATILVIKQMKLNVVFEKINSCNDEMTGFLNRKAFDRDIEAHSGIPREEYFVIGSIDLNCLKNINNSLGREVGDELIKGAAECLKNVFGNSGKLYRTGGDEFVVILFVDGGTLENLKIKLFNEINEWNKNHDNELMISWGFVRKDEYPGKPTEELLKLADAKMYQAKEIFYTSTGRDRRRF